MSNRSAVFATYPGQSPLEKATQYLDVNRVGFNAAHPEVRRELAGRLVRDEQARLLLVGGASVVDQVNTPLGRLKAHLEGETFTAMWDAAFKEDANGSIDVLKSLVVTLAKRDPKAGTRPSASEEADTSTLSAYPGVNDVQRAIAMLSDTRPGFKLQSWSEKNRLAGEFLASMSATASHAPVARVLATSAAETSRVPDHTALLSAYPGVNDVQRAIGYLTDNQPGFKLRPWSEQNYLADRFLQTGVAR